ncbi:hypothetical protein WN51_04952 [Melipona quadrifasciata]|uniref:Mos1 transposase HTH domain-containing protein n=1 Tax=Melipona quadrifasciata TaxID=166423 RepID=A0A0M8ZRK0_9HYME|nr:hypothetical protein WN51_04952 [Melipona quadrifasciata]
MSEIKEGNRYILKFYYEKKGRTLAAIKIFDVYKHDAVSVHAAQSWFKDRHVSSYDIGKRLNVDYKTVLNHLQKAGYKRKLDV